MSGEWPYALYWRDVSAARGVVTSGSASGPVDLLKEIETANEHNYICPWCVHGDHETAIADLDASECIVCDAKCSCQCGHAK